jgi:catechol 2,3-dioxygenase
MPDRMRIGPPVLRVRNIDKVMAFYQNNLGLQVNRVFKGNTTYYNDDNDGISNNATYALDFKQNFSSSSCFSYAPLPILKHDPNSKESQLPSAGLYHFAILVPDRKSLASSYIAIKNSGVQYDGFADHLVSESISKRS